MVKHDENRDLRSFALIGKINYGDKTLRASKTSIGIHMWGRIDYLTKYCGWHFITDNSIHVNTIDNTPVENQYSKSIKKTTVMGNEKNKSKKR